MEIIIKLNGDISNIEADYIAAGVALLLKGTASTNGFRKLVVAGSGACSGVSEALSATNELSLIETKLNEVEKLPMIKNKMDAQEEMK